MKAVAISDINRNLPKGAHAEASAEISTPSPSGPGEEFVNVKARSDLKRHTIRGGALTVSSQFVQVLLYTISTVVLARLLAPEDYGLVGMVTAAIGVLRIFKDAGLSTATVQRESINGELVSTVFWINVSLGLGMALFSIALAPALVVLYHEPRLYWITLVLASIFILDAAGAQHQALLRRRMHFKALAIVDIISMLAGLAVSLIMATAGYGYWALVGMPLAMAVATMLGVWIAEPWRPGRPRRGCGAGSMMRFGGYLTGSNLLNYLFRNSDNMLIGWYWGAGPLGFYQKAYSLLMLPITQVNSPLSGVAIPTLSRLQSDPERQKRFFVSGYSIAVSITLPIVVVAAIFSDDVIRLLLGPKWLSAVGIFRLLAPAALMGAVLNPFGWLFISSGRADRQFYFGIFWTGLIILAFAAGLRFGPGGVAAGYSIASCILALPLCIYAIRGTAIRISDLSRAMQPPLAAVIPAALAAWALKAGLPAAVPSFGRLMAGCLAFSAIYAFVLLVVMKRLRFYRDLLLQLFPGRFNREANSPSEAPKP